MRGRHGIVGSVGILSAFLEACQPMVDASDYVADEFESTYTTWVRADLPAPAGEGDAPLAGSLGPPEHMVEPEMPGPTPLTREGSSGPPMRSGAEPAEPPADPNRRQYLRGHNRDAH